MAAVSSAKTIHQEKKEKAYISLVIKSKSVTTKAKKMILNVGPVFLDENDKMCPFCSALRSPVRQIYDQPKFENDIS
jgi:hypothetical protein